MKIECENFVDTFCYLCGRFTSKKNQRNIDFNTIVNYEAYFDMPLIDHEKSWAPSKICLQCKARLLDWKRKKVVKIEFNKPMEWFDNSAIDHLTDCFFANLLPKV